MIAFDTNMLVRLLVDDHPEQAALAQRLLADNTAVKWGHVFCSGKDARLNFC